MPQKICIIGSGFSSLAAACYLAKEGHQITLVEKNNQVGGRAARLKKNGFTFDMGPTFYWMPDVFERFFADFGKHPSDYYTLEKLNPAYKVFFSGREHFTVGDNLDAIATEFEKREKGAATALRKMIRSAADNYRLAIGDLVYRPGLRLTEIITIQTVKKLGLFFSSIRKMAGRYFKHPHLRQIVEFPVLFLGAKPSDTPAFYNFMNYADFALGTWHPVGGMYEVIIAMEKLALSLGVEILTGQTVEKINVANATVTSLTTHTKNIRGDVFLSGADYAHTETLLPEKYRTYTAKYWNKKTFAPSALLFYVGFDTPLKNVAHHSLFFDTDFQTHAGCIYEKPAHPKDPLFYASFPSKTDPSTAPSGKEAGIFLIPLAPDLTDTPEIRATYFEKIKQRLSAVVGEDITPRILFTESFGTADFVSRYNSYKGNAYGLANTLLQTHYLRPKIKSPKLKNLYFCGQLTVPGPGVPPSLISGKIVSDLILKNNR